MGLTWHLMEILTARGLTPGDLEADLSFPLRPELCAETPPADMTLDDLAAFCQALGCQPGELLSFESEDPTETARRELARNASYQSFLAFQQPPDSDELDDEAEW